MESIQGADDEGCQQEHPVGGGAGFGGVRSIDYIGFEARKFVEPSWELGW